MTASGPLDQKEIDPFLKFLFSDVAVRPEPLALLEAAAVVRYLQLLAANAVPKDLINSGRNAIKAHKSTERTEEERNKRKSAATLAEIVWIELRSNGAFRAANNAEALKFLEKHSKTYFRNPPCLAEARKLVEDFDVPKDVQSPLGPPDLVSELMKSRRGPYTPRFKDDLSERIYAADHALKRTGEKTARVRIAQSLNNAGVCAPVRRRTEGDDKQWTSQDVNERVKEYEKLLRKRLANSLGCPLTGLSNKLKNQRHTLEQEIDELRNRVVRKWVALFRGAIENDAMCSEINRELQEVQRDFSNRLNRLFDKKSTARTGAEQRGHVEFEDPLSEFFSE